MRPLSVIMLPNPLVCAFPDSGMHESASKPKEANTRGMLPRPKILLQANHDVHGSDEPVEKH